MEVRQSIGEKRWPYVPPVAVVVRVQSFVCNISPEGYGVVLEPKETSPLVPNSKFPGFQVPKFPMPSSQVPKFPSSQVSKFLSSQVPQFLSFQVPNSKFPSFQVSNFELVLNFGSLNANLMMLLPEFGWVPF